MVKRRSLEVKLLPFQKVPSFVKRIIAQSCFTLARLRFLPCRASSHAANTIDTPQTIDSSRHARAADLGLRVEPELLTQNATGNTEF